MDDSVLGFGGISLHFGEWPLARICGVKAGLGIDLFRGQVDCILVSLRGKLHIVSARGILKRCAERTSVARGDIYNEAAERETKLLSRLELPTIRK